MTVSVFSSEASASFPSRCGDEVSTALLWSLSFTALSFCSCLCLKKNKQKKPNCKQRSPTRQPNKHDAHCLLCSKLDWKNSSAEESSIPGWTSWQIVLLPDSCRYPAVSLKASAVWRRQICHIWSTVLGKREIKMCVFWWQMGILLAFVCVLLWPHNIDSWVFIPCLWFVFWIRLNPGSRADLRYASFFFYILGQIIVACIGMIVALIFYYVLVFLSNSITLVLFGDWYDTAFSMFHKRKYDSNESFLTGLPLASVSGRWTLRP